MKEHLNHEYSVKEERLNVLTHALGLLLSIVAFPFLVSKALLFEGFLKSASFFIYGLSMIILYTASTFYHASKKPTMRRKLNIFDHAAIYILIAGTYTPFTIIVLEGVTGWILFGVTWFFAISGIILKLFYTGRFDKLSTIIYVLMGWLIVFAINPLMENFSSEGLRLLIYGGISYTIGALLYSLKKLPYNHAIFHIFVVVGSIYHFFSILLYV